LKSTARRATGFFFLHPVPSASFPPANVF
jgi:hypothetical protein